MVSHMSTWAVLSFGASIMFEIAILMGALSSDVAWQVVAAFKFCGAGWLGAPCAFEVCGNCGMLFFATA